MVKRALLVLVIAAGLVWWYERGVGPNVAVPTASVNTPAATPDLPTPGKGAALRPAGGWSPKAWSVLGGKLTPGRALRERFDSYLPLGKGVTMVEVRATLEQDAQADLGSANSTQVLAIWDRYARLQNHDWQHPFNGADPTGWQATLNEQHQVRRQFLGADWADAFFEEDEAALQRRLASLVAAGKLPSKASSVAAVAAGASVASAALGAGVVALASAPVAAASASAADWRVRTDKARQEWVHLTQDATLDEGQRLIRIRQYLQQNFTGPDAARVERDLQLP